MYRDIPPQERTFVTRSFPFTEDKQAFREIIQRQTASGGGDGPEAVASALHKARLLNWKRSKKVASRLSKADALHGVVESVADDSIEDDLPAEVQMPPELCETAQDVTRILIFITDAPPHGIGITGDGFPQGEPVWESKAGQTVGYDPMDEMEQLCKLDITTHFVLSEGYNPCQITRSFYNTMASMSQGRAVRLGDATDLVELVSSCAVEARQMDDLADELSSMMEKLGKEQPEMSKEEVKEEAFRSLATKAPVMTQIACSELNDDSCMHFRSCATLEEMRTKSSTLPRMKETTYAMTPDVDDEHEAPVYRSGGSSMKRGMILHEATRAPPPSPAMRVRSYDGTISKDQMQRLLSRVKV